MLLISSLFFYAWGETCFVFLLIFSIGINYIFGLLIARYSEQKRRRVFLLSGIIINLCLIGFYKYAGFIVETLNWSLLKLNCSPILFDPVHLPLGISFFTFQAMSYLVDVYRRVSPAEKNPLNLGLYISMFPQLVAGPIVRFHEISEQLHRREHSAGDFATGVRRFIVGLGQKMLIANSLAVPADGIFAIPAGGLNCALAWLGIISYTLQIYYDFAGYSNMAIGLGYMFGFRFPENFNYPYVSQSIREFWKRWHMSLSSWFRDYLYIPLGGNRKGPYRTYFNLVVVFFLCGLWHGASWTFVFWGLFHGTFLVLERLGLERRIRSIWRPVGHIYAILVIMTGWVFFRSDSFGYAWKFLGAMLGFAQKTGAIYSISQYLSGEVIICLAVGIAGSWPTVPAIKKLIMEFKMPQSLGLGIHYRLLMLGLEMLVFAGIMITVAMSLAAKTHNPFIYFRF